MLIEGQNEFLTQLVLVLAVPFFAWLLGQGAKALIQAWGAFKSQNATSGYEIEHIFYTAVRAAEQTGFVDGIKKAGKEKLKYALEIADAYLKKSGIDLDEELIRAGIEAAVNELFPKPAAK